MRWAKAFILVLGLFTVAATYTAPRFVNPGTARENLRVHVTWRERGLMENEQVHYVVKAEASTTYVCLDRWNTKPADIRSVRDSISKESDLTATPRGVVRGRITLEPLPPGDFSCGPGEKMQMACVSYWEIELQDQSNAISTHVGGSYTMTESFAGKYCRDEQ